MAGLLKLHAASQAPTGSRVVCVLTGHGLKDPDTATQGLDKPMQVGADLGEIQRALGV